MTIQAVPLSKLVPSPANVRRTGTTERVEELAASIAAHGLLQNLTVKPTEKGRYAVIAGGRRLAALKLLAKQKLWGKNDTVPCQVIEGCNLTEISLAENALQAPMHPADQYEAFAKLRGEGMGVEDIAARFGVSAKTVLQRLKLGSVSPALVGAYRAGSMKLDQLTAFAITDDHALQERVWNDLGGYRSRQAILQALNEGQVPSDDRRAVYVGAEAYTAAGGVITHDLFDEDGSGFFADTALLNRLVTEKLAKAAEAVLAEGWKWVETLPAWDYGVAAALRRIYPQPRTLTEDEEQLIEKLTQQHDSLADMQDEHDPDELHRMLEEIDSAIDAIHGDESFSDEDKGRAGAFVTLGNNGEARIERGFVRREDDTGRTTDDAERESDEQPPKGDLSAKLVTELTAHRTAALANELAQKPDIALTALLHALVSRLFHIESHLSCLDITPRQVFLSGYADDIAESRAQQQIDERHAAWQQRMPGEPESLWSFIAALTDAERLELLAHCASLTVNAVQAPGVAPGHADTLAGALTLDMAAYWQPTAGRFFARVPKAAVMKAVQEGYCVEGAQTLSGLKKIAMAERAEKLLTGKGWLPELLRPVAV